LIPSMSTNNIFGPRIFRSSSNHFGQNRPQKSPRRIDVAQHMTVVHCVSCHVYVPKVPLQELVSNTRIPCAVVGPVSNYLR
jgi:hypothetical protein